MTIFTFTLENGENTVTLTPVENGIYYVVEISDIPSAKLGDMQTVSVTENATGAVVNTWVYSPMSYAYKVLASENPDAALVDVVKALTFYYLSAYTYFSNHN